MIRLGNAQVWWICSGPIEEMLSKNGTCSKNVDYGQKQRVYAQKVCALDYKFK